MRLAHFVQTGRMAGGLERYLATLFRSGSPDLSHAVVTHAAEPCDFCGEWPAVAWPWLAGARRAGGAAAGISLPAGIAVFHGPPSRAALDRVLTGGRPAAAFVHDHAWWCPSGARYHSSTGTICSIRAGTLPCAVRYHALRCGSVRPRAALEGFRRARAGREALLRMRAVLVASRFMRDEAVRHGVPSELVHVVPLPPTVSAAGAPSPASGAGPTVLCVSRLTPLKGIEQLLAAFGAMRVEAQLVLTGTGNAAARLRHMAAAHPACDRILFAGQLDDTALRAAYSRAAVVAVPSLWPEPFGLVGIEALAAGRPVVASGTGGMEDWARKDLGVLVAPADRPVAFAAALDRALSEPVWRERAALAGTAWVAARHGSDAHLRALVEALGPLAAEGGAA